MKRGIEISLFFVCRVIGMTINGIPLQESLAAYQADQ
jgi:hypothetical protein